MIISPQKKILEVDGKVAKSKDITLTYGFVLSWICTNSRAMDALLAYKIIVNCNKEKDFDLTAKHVEVLRNEILEVARQPNRPFNNIVLGQIVAHLDGEDLGVVEQIEPESTSKDEKTGDTVQSTGEAKV